MDQIHHMINSITGIDLDCSLNKDFNFTFQNIIDLIGYSANRILLVVTIFLLRNKVKYL